jgi:arginase
LYSKVLRSLEESCFPLVLGGDHSLSIASVAAVSNYYRRKGEKLGLIWIDTHPDLNTVKTSPSKRIFGTPVSYLLGQAQGLFSSFQEGGSAISFENLAYVGIRDVDKGEKELINKLKINSFSMKLIDIKGVATALEEAIAVASKGTSGFIVSFDLDVCDPSLVPGTGTPKRGGLTYRESHLIIELLYDCQKMRSIEIVELNTILDRDFKTAHLALSLIESAFGKSIL